MLNGIESTTHWLLPYPTSVGQDEGKQLILGRSPQGERTCKGSAQRGEKAPKNALKLSFSGSSPLCIKEVVTAH